MSTEINNQLFVLRHKESQLFVSRDYSCWVFVLDENLANAVFFSSPTDNIVKDIFHKIEWFKHDVPHKLEFELLELGCSVVKSLTLEGPCL